MAIYHLSAKIISRGQGHSAVAAAAYRAGQEMTLEREDVVWDYSQKPGIEHSEIMLPQNAPQWMADRERLWNAVENGERRKDAQLAREIMVALPVELSANKQLELIRGYVQAQYVDRGMVADLAIHRDNPDNPHAHVMLTMRPIDGAGFGKKCRDWNSKEELLRWRQGWEDATNLALTREGHDLRIDHRSFEDQGIALEPGIHHGATAGRAQTGDEYAQAKARLYKLEQAQRRNADAIVADPSLALRAITHQQATFTQRDLARWASTHTADRDDFERVRSAVMNSAELIDLEGGRYTSHEMVQAELALINGAQQLDERNSHKVSGRLLEQAFRSQPNLTEEQRAMVRHVLQGRDLALVEGVAGSGKSWGLQAARVGWESAGYRVHGAALSGRAAQELQASAGITSRSLASWEAGWKHDVRHLGRKDVLVIDEAGMLGSRQLGRVLEHAERAGAKVVLVGDTKQIQSIEAGAAMRLLAERHEKAQLVEVHRQRHAWQANANNEIRHGDAKEGLKDYERMGLLRGHADKAEAMLAVVDAWHQEARQGKEVLMLAHERRDVATFNEAARGRLRADGKLGRDHAIQTSDGSRNFASGDRICFRLRSDELGVVNGTLGTVEGIKGGQMAVRLDGEERRRIAFDTKEYNQIEHGFASTLHRAQGASVDEVVVYAGKHMNRELVYVAMSRQRERVQLHWDKQTFTDREQLYAKLSSSAQKANVQDFAQQEREVRQLARQAQRPKPEIEKIREPQQQQRSREIEQPVRGAPHGEEPERARMSQWMAEVGPTKVLQEYREAQQWSAKKPLAAQEVLAGYVERDSRDLDDAKSAHRFATKRRADFEKQHPIKARLGSKETKELAATENRMKANTERLQKALDKKLGSPKLQRAAETEATQHNTKIRQAKVFEAAVRPHVKGARRTLQNEQEKQREHDRGRGGLGR